MYKNWETIKGIKDLDLRLTIALLDINSRDWKTLFSSDTKFVSKTKMPVPLSIILQIFKKLRNKVRVGDIQPYARQIVKLLKKYEIFKKLDISIIPLKRRGGYSKEASIFLPEDWEKKIKSKENNNEKRRYPIGINFNQFTFLESDGYFSYFCFKDEIIDDLSSLELKDIWEIHCMPELKINLDDMERQLAILKREHDLYPYKQSKQRTNFF